MIGKRLAHYEVLGLLGKGGMGEVHRARDTKLDRDVALKLLPRELGTDPERLARFRREAKVLASLNHTSIASIYGLEEADGQLFLVLELAEGDDLAARIERGPSSIDETLQVARQLARGLEQAHEAGVVHRDLKPANVKLSGDGVVKILDFGLARAFAGESAAEGELENSPTITAAMTQAGTILGTAAYMSPEQARGATVDRRADIWAFGVILFEMLTGRRLFEGDTVSDTLAEVLKTEPDFDELPEETPPVLRWLIERCVQKRASKRLRDIGEACVLLDSDLETLPGSSFSGQPVVLRERSGPRWWALVVVGLVAAGLGALVVRWLQPPPAPPRQIHATLLSPEGTSVALAFGGNLAISPDATRVCFVASDSTGVRRLWVRRLDSPDAFMLTGTEGASYPFWSPDSRRIGFFASTKLRRIDANGGVATAICDAPRGRGGAWSLDGRIVFAPAANGGLEIVPSTGGTPVAFTSPDSMMNSHRWPAMLPGGRHLVYLEDGADVRVWWRALGDDVEPKLLLSGALRPQFGAGHLFYGRDAALWARPFDPATGDFLGEERLVTDELRTSANYSGAVFTVADDGTLVYAVGQQAGGSIYGLYDGEGALVDRVGFGENFADDPNLSADGRYLAVALYPLGASSIPDIWVSDLSRGTLTRVTSGESCDDPVWGPRGDRIVYSHEGRLRVRSMRGAREVLLDADPGNDAIPSDWSRDGKFIAFSIVDEERNIYILPVDDPENFYPLVQDGYFSSHATFSPDGAWIAYTSTENGEPQVFLRSADPSGGAWPVSSGRASQPRWRSDGSGIVFLAGTDFFVEVPVAFTDRGPEFGAERMLFGPVDIGLGTNTHLWAASGDLERVVFAMNADRPGLDRTELQLLVGWPGSADAR